MGRRVIGHAVALASRRLIGALLLLSALASGCPHGAADDDTGARAVSVAELVDRPADFMVTRVRVTGRLVNRGRNPYTHLRLFLSDCEHHDFEIRPWLPISVPAQPPGSDLPPRDVLVNYLGKLLEVTGHTEDIGDTARWLLVVEDARVLPTSDARGACPPPGG